jgi:hypothetical protein
VTVGDREVNLGNHYVGVDDPTFLRTTGREDGTVHYEMTTPDRSSLIAMHFPQRSCSNRPRL